MDHMFESVSVQIFIPSTHPMQDYELWSLHDYRHMGEPASCNERLVCPDTVSEIIVEALLAKGYRLADAEALEGNAVPGYIASPKKGDKFTEEDYEEERFSTGENS